MKNSKFMLLALVSTGLVLSACGGETPSDKKYTYRSYTSALGTKWDPNTWETNADSSLLGYISEGFVGMAPDDTSIGSWQWTYDAAESVEDVTDEHPEDLVRFGIAEDEEEAADITEEYVYEIKLRHGATWETKKYGGKTYGGTAITADDYVESFKILLDPARKNYRANLYYAGESAVANGMNYYYQGSAVPLENAVTPGLQFNIEDLKHEGGKYLTPDGLKVYLAVDKSISGWLGGYTLAFYVDYFGDAYFDVEKFEALLALDTDKDGLLELTDEVYNQFVEFLESEASAKWGEDRENVPYYLFCETIFPEFAFENVGLYKVDDYTIRYVLGAANDIDNFKTHLTSTWLVNPDFYKDLSKVDSKTGLLVSKYNTSAATTISYGPYKMVSYQDKKQVKYTQNEAWWGYEKQEDGTLKSTTEFLVDGKRQPQYQTTDIVIDVMKDATARQKFEKGKLNDYAPNATELPEFTRSSQLYQVDETYTMSFFFNTGLEALQKLDKSGGNTNSVVLSNYNFRKAFSLAIDRADWVTNTEGYKPAYAILNTLYYYDVYNDPTSVYRNTDQAKEAIVKLYGIEYGEGKTYATLDEAYASVTGYNEAEAKKLMKQAYEELLEAKLITAGADVHIKVAYKKGALEAPEYAQINAMNKYLAKAAEGSGFGKVELEAIGDIEDRYAAVPAGDYAIGYGAWGGAAFYPFRNFQVYMDPDQYDVNELGCWDPTKETLTMEFDMNGDGVIDEENDLIVTMTYQQWSQSMLPGGPFANAPVEIKLQVLANLEYDYLNKYYRIPLAGSTSCFLLGYQQHYYTQNYNIMYDFGGFRLMIYDYNDAEWAKYVSSQGGKLNYK